MIGLHAARLHTAQKANDFEIYVTIVIYFRQKSSYDRAIPSRRSKTASFPLSQFDRADLVILFHTIAYAITFYPPILKKGRLL